MGMVIQDPVRYFLGLTCEEEITFGRRGIDAAEILNRVGLQGFADLPPLTLSGGEQRRLAVGSALAPNLKNQLTYLIFDEPFNALDWDGVQRTLKIILELTDLGIAVMIITHDLEKCLAHVDDVILLAEGKTLYQGSVPGAWPHFPRAGLHPPAGGAENWKTMTWLI